MNIQRYDIVGSYDDYLSETDEGEYVKHDDHLAVVAEKDAEIVKWTSLVGRREQIHEAALAAKDAEIERLKRMLAELNAQKHVDSGLVHESEFGGDE